MALWYWFLFHVVLPVRVMLVWHKVCCYFEGDLEWSGKKRN